MRLDTDGGTPFKIERNNCNFNWVHSRSKSWFHLWMKFIFAMIINNYGNVKYMHKPIETECILIWNIPLPLVAMHK